MELCVLDARTVRRVIPSSGRLACHFRNPNGGGCECMGTGHGRATRVFELEDSDCAWTLVTVSLWLPRRAGAWERVGWDSGCAAVVVSAYGFWRGRGKKEANHCTLYDAQTCEATEMRLTRAQKGRKTLQAGDGLWMISAASRKGSDFSAGLMKASKTLKLTRVKEIQSNVYELHLKGGCIKGPKE